MGETGLNVVCKSCGAEVSPYVTECPYCGVRLRKRAPDLELGGDGGLEPKQSRREKRRNEKARRKSDRQPRTVSGAARPWATIVLILIPAIALLVRIATGTSLDGFGGVIVPFEGEWWRFITAPFAYLSVGYLFAVGVALSLFAPGLERRLGTIAVFVMLVACGSLGALAAYAVADQRDALVVIAGGNGIALGAILAWFTLNRVETMEEGKLVDLVGVLIAATVILLLPVVVPTADFWSGLAGGLVGAIAGLTATRFQSRR